MAPPAERVPQLIDDLFEWLTKADDHLLIRSCVFHYEFEFIHPFGFNADVVGQILATSQSGKTFLSAQFTAVLDHGTLLILPHQTLPIRLCRTRAARSNRPCRLT